MFVLKGKHPWILWLAAVVAAVGLLVPAAAWAATQTGDVVIATNTANFGQVGGDPATQNGYFPVPSRTVFDSLIWADENQNMLPGLAKSWKIAPDGKNIEFTLRDDVTFHNGDKFTAEDVKYSLETYMRKELRYLFSPFWRKNFTGIEILGPYQVRINFKDPDPGFPARMWWGTGFFGKKYRESVGDKGFADKPVGTGPFKWVEYKQDVYWKVEAVPKHFRHTPEYKTLKVLYVPENSTRMAMLKAGEADIAQLIGPSVADVKADPKLRIVLARYPILQCLIFADIIKPELKSPFLDIRVREAASLAIDRETICKKVLFGVSEPYGDYCSPITWGHDPSIKPDPYNPERAKALLKEAGYANGFDTTFSTGEAGKFWAEAVAANLTEVGIRTKVEVMETGVFIDKVFSRTHTGLVPKPLWYNAEKHASAEASDDFIQGMPWAYTTTPEINQAVMDGMKASSEADMIAAGKRISKAIRESRVRLLLWVNHVPYGVGSRIAYWQPEIGAMPAAAYEMIRLKK